MNDVVSSQSLEAPPRRSARWLKLTVVVALCVGGLAYAQLTSMGPKPESESNAWRSCPRER